MEGVTAKRVPLGGEFLILDHEQEIFVPEELTEEQHMIRIACRDFVEQMGERIHKLDEQPALMKEAGELGLVGAHIPEMFGGMEMDKNTVTAILEELGRAGGSFDTTFAAHTGIGMLPILYFGTDEIKRKYLPELSSGQKIAAYCLTEPGSGSDALGAKSTAKYNAAEKTYFIEGQKIWISNAGFADVFIVFAQVEGEGTPDGKTGFTGFVVDADAPGIRLGAEEDKLGIKGSSTRQVFFEGVTIPEGNLLGEIGRGHIIAFNILNIGRFKLGNMCLGGMKRIATIGVKYANERHQFKVPISSFGAIQYKIAQQHIMTFALESAVYRVSNLMKVKNQEFIDQGMSFEMALLESAEEYAIECAIIKVFGSEALDYVVDELVQIHGGYGFSEEYPAARAYRDARINRIYEGTNEINRLLSINMLMKRVMKGELNMTDAAWAVQKELTKLPSFGTDTTPLGAEKTAVQNLKKIALLTAGAAVKYQMDGKLNLVKEQQIVTGLADILIQTFMAESTLLRVMKLKEMNDEQYQLKENVLKVVLHDAQDAIAKASRDCLASFATGDEKRIMLMGIQRFANYPPQNVAALRTTLAKASIENNAYCLLN